MRLLLPLLLLSGCTTATIELADGTKVNFTRFATDAAFIATKDSVEYSSSPSAVAQQNAIDALTRAVQALIAAPGV